jgi:DNA anti-recombination protein RmuC
MNEVLQQQYQEDASKKREEQNQKNQRMNDLQAQIEENQRKKKLKLQEEKQRDALLVKEFEGILVEREHERNAVGFGLRRKRTG